jgi:hypothetical protein
MNYIQRAWLKVLSPIIPLVNEKLAKRSGVIGRMARFFAFGPRQFGYHPSTRFLLVINAFLKQVLAFQCHKYPFIRYATWYADNWQPITIYTHDAFSYMAYFLGIWSPSSSSPNLSPVTLRLKSNYPHYIRGTTAEDLRKEGLPAHYSSVNDRVSAHYTEINSLYNWEMLKKVHKVWCSWTLERNRY